MSVSPGDIDGYIPRTGVLSGNLNDLIISHLPYNDAGASSSWALAKDAHMEIFTVGHMADPSPRSAARSCIDIIAS
jgi:hypothetical protein